MANEMTTINIDADIHRKLKVKCAKQGKTIKKVVEKLILAWLEEE